MIRCCRTLCVFAVACQVAEENAISITKKYLWNCSSQLNVLQN